MKRFLPAQGSRLPSSRPEAESRLEIQIHPGNIRRRVRYIFLSHRQVAAVVAGVALYLAYLGFAAAVAPRVLANLLSLGEYQALMAERTRQGERLQALVDRVEFLGQRSEQLQLRMQKIYLAYGLTGQESIGQGGYPFVAQPAPESIYANVIHHGHLMRARVEEQLRVLDTFLMEIQAFEEAHQFQVRSTPSICPLQGEDFVLTSPFGNRRSPFTKTIDFHAGIDLAAPRGTPVYAPADGIVVFAGRYPLSESVAWWRYGKMVVLRNGDRFMTLFGHCDEVKVRRGQKVRQGDVLATVGTTGWSTSPHLHYEVRRRRDDGEYVPVDPRIYILDHRWRDEERLLVRARSAPEPKNFEPLPRLLTR